MGLSVVNFRASIQVPPWLKILKSFCLTWLLSLHGTILSRLFALSTLITDVCPRACCVQLATLKSRSTWSRKSLSCSTRTNRVSFKIFKDILTNNDSDGNVYCDTRKKRLYLCAHQSHWRRKHNIEIMPHVTDMNNAHGSPPTRNGVDRHPFNGRPGACPQQAWSCYSKQPIITSWSPVNSVQMPVLLGWLATPLLRSRSPLHYFWGPVSRLTGFPEHTTFATY